MGGTELNTTGLTPAQVDRATGAVVGMAVGNALGNGYAFELRPEPSQIRMRAGGLAPYLEGEWADDMAMALPILEALAAGKDLLAPSTQDEVAARWAQWFATAKDVAPMVARILGAYDPDVGAQSLQRTAAGIFAAGQAASAGNASLMRTGPITLGYLHDPDAMAAASRVYSELTHANPEAGEACVLWNFALRHAILHGQFDLVSGLAWIPEPRQELWERLINQAEVGLPQDFAIRNGWVGQTLQTAWSAINHAVDGPEQYENALRAVIAAGGDTATVSAIAGSMLGARWGVSAIPLDWRRRVNGWPGWRDRDLVRSVWEVVSGRPWPAAFDTGPIPLAAVQHPDDSGLWFGGITGLRPLPVGVDAVVSLCQLGDEQVPQPAVLDRDQVNVWLLDSDDPADNPNLDMVAEQTVAMLSELRDEGKTVYLHCDDGRSRAPFVAALYGARIGGRSGPEALRAIQQVMPEAQPNPLFEQFIRGFG